MKSCLIGISRDVEMVRGHKQKSRSPNLVRSHRSGKHLCGVCVAMLAERQRPTPASRQPIRAYQERRVDLLWEASFRSRNGEVLCVDSVMCQCIGNQTASVDAVDSYDKQNDKSITYPIIFMIFHFSKPFVEPISHCSFESERRTTLTAYKRKFWFRWKQISVRKDFKRSLLFMLGNDSNNVKYSILARSIGLLKGT